MSNIHGIIACAGNGIRYAQSVGKPYPYPKHLEMLGGKSVLNRALDGLMHNIPVESVTFTLNPQLKDVYLKHLLQLQDAYPDTPFSYVSVKEIAGARLFTNIQETVKHGVYQMGGQEIHLGNPIVAVTLGDSVITHGNKDRLRQDIKALLPFIKEGKCFAIFRDPKLKGLMYWLSKASELGEGEPDFTRSARDYGLRWWNCNTRDELLVAQRELDYYRGEGELRSLNYHPRKEAW